MEKAPGEDELGGVKVMQNAECKVQNERLTPEEIAKPLRVCAERNCCPECIEYDDALAHCADVLKREAADLIEAQAKRIAELEGQLILRQNELLKLREENRWIPVEERKPDVEYAAALAKGLDDVEVIVMIEGAKEPTALRYDGTVGVFFTLEAGDDGDELILYRVTRWKPMPKGSEG